MGAGPDEIVADGELAAETEREAPPVHDGIGQPAVAIVRSHKLEWVAAEAANLNLGPTRTAKLEDSRRIDLVDLRAVDEDRVVRAGRSERVSRLDIEGVCIRPGVDDERDAVYRELVGQD